MLKEQRRSSRRQFRKDPDTFDGNFTDPPVNLLYPTEEFTEVTPSALDELMEMTAEGNLAWVIFPVDGYRL